MLVNLMVPPPLPLNNSILAGFPNNSPVPIRTAGGEKHRNSKSLTEEHGDYLTNLKAGKTKNHVLRLCT